ncbi:MAG: Epi-isozizaene 5-monooxygenase/(E)-beta-farnesene synthase [Nocardioides sp.]|nr:Epi-isozizaene 5-monooxygenase/(E)-beta-farnesene synthase [Nocardioides sp.]
MGSPVPVPLGPGGPTLVTTLEDSKDVLVRSEDFVVPFNVSRERIRSDRDAVKHTPPLSREAVARGLVVLSEELDRCTAGFAGPDIDTLDVLRGPVSRSTAAALLPEADATQRDRIADLVLGWIDSLAPVIAAPRPPRRWTRIRRTESRSRHLLITGLAEVGCEHPRARATALAAGTQVPIAAGAWSLTQLACRPHVQTALRADSSLTLGVVWETLRLFPPTWLLPRVSTRDVRIGGVPLPAYSIVLVSPLALGRLEGLVPGPDEGFAPLAELDPTRWRNPDHRPGAWLPFGAGVHSCPGRSLGLAQLDAIVAWASGFDLWASRAPGIDASRGLAPAPATIDVRPLTRR